MAVLDQRRQHHSQKALFRCGQQALMRMLDRRRLSGSTIPVANPSVHTKANHELRIIAYLGGNCNMGKIRSLSCLSWERLLARACPGPTD